MKTYQLAKLHAHTKQLLHQVVTTQQAIEIKLPAQRSVVVMSKDRYAQLLELNYLWETGSLPAALQQLDLEADVG
ncbi:type II toxin-antitoxin system Phd/YefM family antitoxin [Levilactobacillus enshiensis]|uniref:type II toxin-antitoxin system Phd/YefM family antitoxin n=1 Tax=Levilactobacillus enshiensis TaxID=2590213 RepID=UPI00117A6A87|nr:type II toxin-antitoxin system Phd/YefM family antitoxin [Levilactobacillus enshiensis]